MTDRKTTTDEAMRILTELRNYHGKIRDGEALDVLREALAEVDALRGEVERRCKGAAKLIARAEKAETALEDARPLLEAAIKLEMMEFCPDNSDSLTDLMKAALAYRKAKEKK